MFLYILNLKEFNIMIKLLEENKVSIYIDFNFKK